MRIVIYGNAGSGKSTLARSYAKNPGVQHLDLDEIAWTNSGVRRAYSDSIDALNSFMGTHESWVIEGCYGTLIREAARFATELIFLNPGIKQCQKNCISRPWDPHKYKTREAQDENLKMLLGWVADYEDRTDEFSLHSHKEIFESFSGKKVELKTALEIMNISVHLRSTLAQNDINH